MHPSIQYHVALAIAFTSILPSPAAAIIGGVRGSIDQFPFMASLRGSSHRCGAAFVNPRQLLTAASCIEGRGPSSFVVRAKTATHASGGVDVNLQQIHVHPDFDSVTFANNIAILDLIEPLGGIKAVNLPVSAVPPPAGTSVTLVGWGATSPGGHLPAVIQFVDVPVVANDVCKQRYENDPGFTITQSSLCDGPDEGGKGACQGDSGGPVLQGDQVVGIISHGLGCAKAGYPDINTAVGPYLDWIKGLLDSQ